MHVVIQKERTSRVLLSLYFLLGKPIDETGRNFLR